MDHALRRRLLIVSLLLTVGVALPRILDQRVPRGHETATLYSLQHFFACAASQDGRVPGWDPFAAGGVPSGPLLAAQSTLAQPLLLLAAPLFRGAPFPPLFHLGLLVEEIVLLLGSWRLASRYFRSVRTVFFVSIAAVGSAPAMDNAWLNLHTIFALPLVASFLHDHARTGARSGLLLAGLWIALATTGLPPSLAPVPFVVATLYAIGLRFFLRGAPPVLAGAAFLGALLPAAVATLSGAASLSLEGPRSAGTWIRPLAPLELALGVGADLDASLYCGIFTLALALLGLAGMPRDLRTRLLAVCVGALLTLCLLLSTLFVLAPALAPAHPLPVGTPVLRMILVFLSGVGFERLLARDREGLPGLRRAASGLFVLCLGLAALSAAAVLDEEIVEVLIEAIAPEFSRSPLRSSLALVSDLLGISSLFAGLAGLSFGLVASAPRAAPAGLLLVLLLHPLDLLGWKFRSEWLATLSAGPDPELRHRIGDLPFRARRELQEEIQRRKSASEERARRSDLILRRSGYAGAWTLEDVSDGPAPFGLRAAPGPAPSRKIRFYQGEATPSGPEMADLPHRVTRFGADDLEVQVATAPEGAWMTYSDAWATGWDGAVNGARVPVHRVDGVKAVRLEPGQNVIRLSYRSRLRSWGGLLMGVPALAGLASLIWIVVRMGRHEAAE